MSDANLVACEQEHEMKTVLEHFKKSAGKENLGAMHDACKAFKADDAFKPHNRESFYRYLEAKGILAGLK